MLNQDWCSYKILDTSLLFRMRGCKGLQFDIGEGDEAAKLLVDKVLMVRGQDLFFLIPGYEGVIKDISEKEEEKVDLGDKKLKLNSQKHIIPSPYLLTYRKSLYKLTQKPSSEPNPFSNTEFWIEFSKKFLNLTSTILKNYISFLFQPTSKPSIKLLGFALSLSPSKRLSLLVDLRYLNILIFNNLYLLSLAFIF
mmetsp:Transcript_19086/g.16914  ORF Transcript_19086/g.16914 Transcript_19086/m.16914 type:complete len:195 (+) Transcript_19086:357-941(+)